MGKDNLADMLDSLAEAGVYIIERDSHKLLYFNRRVKEVSPAAELGKRCDEVWAGTCSDCPLLTIGTKESNHTIHYDDPFGAVVDIVANKMVWQSIPAYVIVVMPHKMNYEEQRARRRVDNMYSRSLVTVFGECIIVNFNEDFYVNCQKDNVWGTIPERGDFARMNQKYAAQVVHPEDLNIFNKYFSKDAMFDSFKAGKTSISKRMRRLTDDGTYHMVEFLAARIANYDEEECWGVLVYRDVNEEFLQEQKAKALLEEALHKMEMANIAKSEFLSRMSHDIRTPMNAIVGMTTLAKLHTGDEEKLKDYLEKIEVSSRHLLNLINEVLDVSKIECGKMELDEREVDLERLAREVIQIVHPIAQAKNQVIHTEIEQDIHCTVMADAARLQQVLVNILENASKYTETGGEIHFSLKEKEKEEKKFGTYQFIIEDNGIGMKKEYLEHIFEPFSREEDYRKSKVSGTGLGMTIVRNIVDMMNGDIQIESEYGKGSRFTVTVCLMKKKESVQQGYDNSLLEEDFTNVRILLVEDNKLNQQIAEEMLTFLGAEVELAENGKEAVKAVLDKPRYYYDLVFMDIQMPVMNGYEATEAIRNSGKPSIDELPIIAMTANAFLDDVKKSKLAGMTGHMSKPIDMQELKYVLSKCCWWRRRKRGEMLYETEGNND